MIYTLIFHRFRKEFKQKLEDVGWRKAMEEKCRMHIREKDLNSVSVDELIKYLQESLSMYFQYLCINSIELVYLLLIFSERSWTATKN